MNKEFGSDFPFLSNVYNQNTKDHILHEIDDSRLYFSGRSAIYNLLKFGITQFGWKTVYFPDYYCHEVSMFIKPLAISVKYYKAGPNLRTFDFSSLDHDSNVIVNVSFFGLLTSIAYEFKRAILIDDHTHDVTQIKTTSQTGAHYCFASLRKILPVPCGGLLWSPKKNLLPVESPNEIICENASFMKLTAMLMKEQYLFGKDILKNDFRKLYSDSEGLFSNHDSNGKLPEVVINLIKSISISKLNKAKAENIRLIFEFINKKELIFHYNSVHKNGLLGLLLMFQDINTRDLMKAHLIKNQIYPAVLWPGQFTSESQDFSDRMLFIHCDIRHTIDDIKIIADVINQW